MATLTLRTLTNPGDTTKSTYLTSAEVDQNFIGLKSELEQKIFLDGGPQVVTSELEFSADTLDVGTNTGVAQYNFASGATTSGNTKTVNFGTGGLAGSTTAINFGTTVGAVSYTFNGTSAVKVPVGADVDRPVGEGGMLRFNSTINKFEGHNGTTWSSVPHEQDVVLLTGDQTVGGVKTFSSSPIVPAGATGTQVPRRNEVVGISGDETITGAKSFTHKVTAGAASTSVGTAGSAGTLEVGTPAGAWAVMSFHKSGYAINMGLDSDNVFRLGGWSQGTNVYRFSIDTAGNFTATGNITAYSDIRLKTDLTKIAGAVEKVKLLTGYTFTRIDSGERHTGLIAQDVQKVMPEAVMESDGHLSVAYGNLMGLLVEAIKELNDRIDQLEGKR